MVYICHDNLRSDLMAEILEHCIIKILCVINYEVLRDTIAADDILPDEFFDGCRDYVCDGLCLNPLVVA
jgi:hypothetical protein